MPLFVLALQFMQRSLHSRAAANPDRVAARHTPPAGGVPGLRHVTALVVPTACDNHGNNMVEPL